MTTDDVNAIYKELMRDGVLTWRTLELDITERLHDDVLVDLRHIARLQKKLCKHIFAENPSTTIETCVEMVVGFSMLGVTASYEPSDEEKELILAAFRDFSIVKFIFKCINSDETTHSTTKDDIIAQLNQCMVSAGLDPLTCKEEVGFLARLGNKGAIGYAYETRLHDLNAAWGAAEAKAKDEEIHRRRDAEARALTVSLRLGVEKRKHASTKEEAGMEKRLRIEAEKDRDEALARSNALKDEIARKQAEFDEMSSRLAENPLIECKLIEAEASISQLKDEKHKLVVMLREDRATMRKVIMITFLLAANIRYGTIIVFSQIISKQMAMCGISAHDILPDLNDSLLRDASHYSGKTAAQRQRKATEILEEITEFIETSIKKPMYLSLREATTKTRIYTPVVSS